MIKVQFHKDVIKDGDPSEVELDGDGIAFNQLGCIVVMRGKEDVVGMFPGGHVAGVYTTDPPKRVQIIDATLVN